MGVVRSQPQLDPGVQQSSIAGGSDHIVVVQLLRASAMHSVVPSEFEPDG